MTRLALGLVAVALVAATAIDAPPPNAVNDARDIAHALAPPTRPI